MSDALRGRFVWHELMTSDSKAGAGFYAKVVGWKPQPWDKDPTYTLLMMNKSRMAGVVTLPKEAKASGTPPSWMTYIGTPDVDATMRQAVELGGKVHRPPMDIPGVGRFAILQDPQGATFAAFNPAPGSPDNSAGAKPGLGDFSWHELLTTDWASALDFYHNLFGWEATESMDMGPSGRYQMYGWKGHTLGGMFTKPAGMPGPPFWLPYSLVPDSKRAAETIEKLGGKVINGPMEVPGGDWITQGVDPQGAMFAVHSRKSTTAAAPRRSRQSLQSPQSKKGPGKPAAPAKKSAVAKSAKPSAKPATKPRPAKRSAGKATRPPLPLKKRGLQGRSAKKRR